MALPRPKALLLPMSLQPPLSPVIERSSVYQSLDSTETRAVIRDYFTETLLDRLQCTIDGHRLCVVDDGTGIHHQVSTDELEIWVNSLV